MPVLGTDIAIHGLNGKFVAAVELKNRQHLTREGAISFRHRMALRGQLPAAEYLLLLSQDRGFLWTQQETLPNDAPPAVEFSMKEVVASYAPTIRPEDRLGETELHLIVSAWLRELANGHAPSTPASTALSQTEFTEAIHDGTWMWETT